MLLTNGGALYIGQNNNNPELRLGTTNGHNLGVSTSGASFSASAATGDMILRSINKLILQSGTGNGAIIIYTANNNLILAFIWIVVLQQILGFQEEGAFIFKQAIQIMSAQQHLKIFAL